MNIVPIRIMRLYPPETPLPATPAISTFFTMAHRHGHVAGAPSEKEITLRVTGSCWIMTEEHSREVVAILCYSSIRLSRAGPQRTAITSRHGPQTTLLRVFIIRFSGPTQ